MMRPFFMSYVRGEDRDQAALSVLAYNITRAINFAGAPDATGEARLNEGTRPPIKEAPETRSL